MPCRSTVGRNLNAPYHTAAEIDGGAGNCDRYAELLSRTRGWRGDGRGWGTYVGGFRSRDEPWLHAARLNAHVRKQIKCSLLHTYIGAAASSIMVSVQPPSPLHCTGGENQGAAR